MTQTTENIPLLFRPNLAGQRYAWQLAAAYRRGLWVYDPDYATISDTEAWEKIRRDAVFAAAIHKRQSDAAGLDWSMEPHGDDPADVFAAEVMEDLIGEIRRARQSRQVAAEAIFRGDSWMFIRGRRGGMTAGRDREAREWWYPTRLQHVDRRRFRLVRDDDGDDVRTRWTMWSISKNEWLPLERPEWFMRCVFDDTEQMLGYGRGLLQALFFFWRAKSIAVSQGLQGLERWANGLVTAAIDGARIGSHTVTNELIVDDWLELLNRTRTEHFIAHDKRDELKVHWPGSSGHELVKFWVEYFDRSARELVLSSNLPTGGGRSDESGKRAETEQEEKEGTSQADRAQLAEDFDRSVARLTWNLNARPMREALRAAGLGSARRPRYRLAREEVKESRKDKADFLATVLGTQQVEVPRDWAHEQLDIPIPQEGEETYGGPQEQPEQPGGLGFRGTAGEPCEPGETAKKTGCVPRGGEEITVTPAQKRVDRELVRGAYDAVEEKIEPDVPGEPPQCHQSCAVVREFLEDRPDALGHKERTVVYEWDEAKWDEVAKYLREHDFEAAKSEPTRNLIEDIADGTVNGHSFTRLGNTFIDPFLRSQGVSQKEINAVGHEMARVFEKVGLEPETIT